MVCCLMRECISSLAKYSMCCSTGRTGRAGHQGKAITFFTEDDKPLLRRYVDVKHANNRIQYGHNTKYRTETTWTPDIHYCKLPKV